jgi:restriction endonuclease S subunit
MRIIKNIFRKDLTQDEYHKILDTFERDIIEQDKLNVELMKKNRELEQKLAFYNDKLKALEGIKVEEKSNVKLWKWLAAIGAGIGALFGSWLTKEDKD